jgi:D-serine deaminase-like pyridoxal phosphate-dependent protein
VTFADLRSRDQLDGIVDLHPAALVVSTVVSRPGAGRVTLDAGNKALSVDTGPPSGRVLGLPGATLRPSSEEHLPVELPGGPGPALGRRLAIAPSHVCTTVALYTDAIVRDVDASMALIAIEARGRPSPLRGAPGVRRARCS